MLGGYQQKVGLNKTSIELFSKDGLTTNLSTGMGRGTPNLNINSTYFKKLSLIVYARP